MEIYTLDKTFSNTSITQSKIDSMQACSLDSETIGTLIIELSSLQISSFLSFSDVITSDTNILLIP